MLHELSESHHANVHGEVEIITKNRWTGNIVSYEKHRNLIKIDAKSILAHTVPNSKVWDPTAGGGVGAWTTHNLGLDRYTLKYIVFGASFDDNGNPLDIADSRFYVPSGTGVVPVALTPGANYDGGLINAIKVADPGRPLKKIERISFEPTYQPSGTPLLQADVRPMDNIVKFETVLTGSEYNGYNGTSYFTITEVALVAGPEIGLVGNCECNPRDLMLIGPYLANCNGTATIHLDHSVLADVVKEGDRIKIVEAASTAAADAHLGQVNPYYLITNKAVGGRDITLDRVPVNASGTPLNLNVSIYRDDFMIYAHRILKTPIKKSPDVELTVRWSLIFN